MLKFALKTPSDFSNEAYIKAERYPCLIKFCAIHKEHVKSYIFNFESVEAAKKNLHNKMKIAFANVRGKKKRGPGIDIDLKTVVC